MRYILYFSILLLAFGCLPSNTTEDSHLSIIKNIEETEEQINRLISECSPEQLINARRISDSLYNNCYLKDSLLKKDPNLKLLSKKNGLLIALHYVHLFDESDSTFNQTDSISSYVIPEDLIQKNNEIDMAKLRERKFKGELKKDTTLIITTP